MKPLHLDEAVELVKDPFDGHVQHLLGTSQHTEGDPSIPPRKRKTTAKGKGIKHPTHNVNEEKFSHLNLPANLKSFLTEKLNKNTVLHKDRDLLASCLNLFGSSLAKSTWKRYGTAFHWWEKFCACKNVNINNFESLQRIAFLCWLNEEKTFKPSTVSMYYSAMKKMFQLFHDFDDSAEENIAKIILKGIKNVFNKKPAVCKKIVTPVSLTTLKKFQKLLKKSKHKKTTKTAVWAASLVAFWGCFRLGEILCKKKLVFDKYTNLLWNNVQWDKSFVTLTIKSSKTSGAIPVEVKLGKLKHKLFCPYRALKDWQKMCKTKNLFSSQTPVFRKNNGKNVTPQFLMNFIGKSEPNGLFSGKSFRSGIPSLLALHPELFNTNDLKGLGRWKSNAYQNYIREENPDLKIYHKTAKMVLKLFLCRSSDKKEQSKNPHSQQQ